MEETRQISDQLERAFRGEAWHGPSVLEVLSDVTADTAGAYPLKGAHSIWEIVLHIVAWERLAQEALEGAALPKELPAEEDWPKVGDCSYEAWEHTLQIVEEQHRRLEVAVSNLQDSDLSTIVTGRSYSVYFLLHGIIQHDLYHAGQISLLKLGLKKA
jgi:uncharacterized damage-inducible protein DinB